MRWMQIIFICLGGVWVLQARAEFNGDSTGLQASVSVDIVGQAGIGTPTMATNRLLPREAEVVFYSPADWLFDGMLNFAAHQEGGKAFFEIHEVAISSSKLIPRSRFRIGQFFLGLGRLNTAHRHDWYFTTAPKVQRNFFGLEGAVDSGIEYSFLVPVPFYLDLTAGVTNGWVFGHAHVEGSAPKTPTHYFKASTYLELPADGGVQISANYLGRKNSENARTSLLGLDFVAKWRDAARLAFLLQGEVWHRWTGSASGKVDRELGAYIFPQVGLTQQWYLGARLDAFSNLNKVDNLSRSQSNLDLAVVPALTYRPSEFATIRLSYNHEAALLQGAPSVHQKMIEFQAVFILGAHPAHDF